MIETIGSIVWFALIFIIVVGALWLGLVDPYWQEHKKAKVKAKVAAKYKNLAATALQIPARPDSELIDDEWWQTNITAVFDSHKEVLKISEQEFDLFKPNNTKPITKAKEVKVFGYPHLPNNEAVNVRMRLRDSFEDEIVVVYMPFNEIGIVETLEKRFIKQYPQYVGKVIMLEYDFDPVTHMPASLEETKKPKVLAMPGSPAALKANYDLAKEEELDKEFVEWFEFDLKRNKTYNEMVAELEALEEDVPPFRPSKYF